MTGYVNSLKLSFEDKDSQDEANADMEQVQYEGCICDMFKKIHTFNDTVKVSGASQKKMILQRLPQKILEQMQTVDLMAKTDQEMYTIISNGGRIAEKCEAARKNGELKALMKTYDKKHHKLERGKEKSEGSEYRKFGKRKPRKDRKE